MIDNKNLLRILRTEPRKMSNGERFKFLIYKKDRSISVEKTGDSFETIENGYRKIVWHNLAEVEALKQIKKLQKIEFPRSDRLYLVRN